MTERVRYADNRPYVVPESLDELTGPTGGLVELPVMLDWSPRRSYDLADPRQLRLLYERAIREAGSVADLRAYLNGTILREVWPDLFLPRQVLAVWYARFPDLLRAAA